MFMRYMRICGGGLGLCLIVVVAALAGCGEGESTVTVKGKILKGGQPLAVEKRDDGTGKYVNVELAGAGELAGSASAEADGSFTIPNSRPGTYKLVVTHIDPRSGGPGGGGPPGGGPPGGGPPGVGGDGGVPKMDFGEQDLLKGQFSSTNSTIEVTISKGASGEIDLGTIDLDKPDTHKVSK